MPETKPADVEKAADTVASPNPDYPTAAEQLEAPSVTVRTDPSLSFSPDLEEVPGSTAPARADGAPVAHVRGPQQAAVDPVAAGLDTGALVATTDTNRMINRTGEAAAGPRPVTYAQTGQDVQQASPADGALVPAVDGPDVPGPSGPSPAEATTNTKPGKPAKPAT